MANIKSAIKRARQADARRLHNASIRSRMRTFIKKVRMACEAEELENAQAAFKAAVPVIDKTAQKGIIHKNTAARYKSRLNAQVKKLFLAQKAK
jgi:small subunit ribosomal protein S20